MDNLTFVSLFESQEDELRSSLEGCRLPKDAKKLQTIVETYMSKMFDSDGEMRMQLTQSEDYILQAAISLLNAQQQMATKMADCAFTTSNNEKLKKEATAEAESSESKSDSTSLLSGKVNGNTALSGSAIGSIGGGLLFGTWGAVFGAIAGTALVLYVSASSYNNNKTEKPQSSIQPTFNTSADFPIDVDQYLAIIKNLCRSLDALIETFRSQIRRVIEKYETQENPSLEREYRVLLEGIQALVGFKRAHSEDEPKYLGKLQTRIEDVVEALDNYDLIVVDYTPEKAHMFEELPSANVTEPKMIAPAVIKGGNVILKGKVFVRE